MNNASTRKTKRLKRPKSTGVAKVPVIIQLEYRECGAACLAMVAAYYGKWVSLEAAREDCGVSRNGTSAGHIAHAARSYGFTAKGYSLEPDRLQGKIHFPCIIHWDMRHFVVLCGFRGGKAIICSPSKGYLKIDREEFDRRFTGVCIDITPTDEFSPSGERRSVLTFAKKRLVGLSAAVAALVFIMILNSVFGIINPFLDQYFFDDILGVNGAADNAATGVTLGALGQTAAGASRNTTLYPFIGLMAALAAVQIILSLVQTLYRLKLNGRMAYQGSGAYMWSLLHKPVVFFTQRKAGDLLLRQETNATITMTLVNTLAPLFLQTVMMVFYLVIMVRRSPVLTLVGLVTVAVNLVLSRVIADRRMNLTRVLLNGSSRLSSETVSGIERMETIQASGAEVGFFRSWAGYQASVNAGRVQFAKMNAYLGIIPAYVSLAANDVVMLCGVYLTMRGKFSLGLTTAFLGFLSSFMSPANTLISAGQTLQEMRTDMERVEDVMEYPDDVYATANENAIPTIAERNSYTKRSSISKAAEKKKPVKGDKKKEQRKFWGTADNEETKKIKGALEAQNITFAYAKYDKPVIKNISFKIARGETLALVGHSGCGKTTITRLLAGLYIPQDGAVLYDNKPLPAVIEEAGHSGFTHAVAVLDQDLVLFPDTIAANLKMWDESISDETMIAAAKDAQIHDEIMQKDGGYEHILAEGGSDLSGGQRQRLEIARALVRNPSVLIMDEATSALDAETEQKIMRAIKKRHITCIIVSHRLVSVRDADEILVIDNGKIKERGTYDELLKQNGRFTKLVDSGATNPPNPIAF